MGICGAFCDIYNLFFGVRVCAWRVGWGRGICVCLGLSSSPAHIGPTSVLLSVTCASRFCFTSGNDRTLQPHASDPGRALARREHRRKPARGAPAVLRPRGAQHPLRPVRRRAGRHQAQPRAQPRYRRVRVFMNIIHLLVVCCISILLLLLHQVHIIICSLLLCKLRCLFTTGYVVMFCFLWGFFTFGYVKLS